MNQIAPDNFEIIIINDGSTDNSEEVILRNIQGKNYFNYQRHKVNKGIGMSLRKGYALAKNENICAVPGDCQFNFKELLMCPSVGENQFVSFYRRRTNYNLYRMFLNHFNRFVNYIFLGLKMNDVNWIKVYPSSMLKPLNLELESSLVESEICAKLFAQNFQCVEIESEYLERLQDKPKGGSFKTVKQALKDLIKLIRIVKIFKRTQHVK